MTDRDSIGPDSQSQVPDAAPPQPMPEDWEVIDYSQFLGGEAAVPTGDYGPPIPSVLPESRSVTRELRELERRVRARLSPAFPLETRRRLPLGLLWRRYRDLALRSRSTSVDPFGRDPAYASRIAPVLEFLYARYFRTEVVGLEHIPSEGPAILVANHSGALPFDAAMLMYGIERDHSNRRRVRALIEDSIFHAPYIGTLLNRLGAVRACQRNARRLLDEGQLALVFPEGIKGMGKLYRDRYKLQRFGRGGFAKLALAARAPIIPVAIVGAEESQPVMARMGRVARALHLPYLPITPTFPLLGLLGLLPLPSKWKVRIGAPIDLSAEHPAEAAEDRVLVSQEASRIREQIQDMINEILSEQNS